MLSLTRKNKPEHNYSEYGQFVYLRLFSFFIIAITVTGIIMGMIFIYDNIYSTVTRTSTALFLKNELNQEAINFESYDSVNKKWDEKINLSATEITKDPFNSSTTTPSTTSNTSAGSV